MMSKKLAALILVLGVVAHTASAANDVPFSDPVSQSVETIVEQFKKAFTIRQAVVASVSGDKVYLVADEKSGIVPGMEFDVVKQGAEIKHPDTGEVIGREEIPVGTIKVTSLRPNMAIATIMEQEEGQTIVAGNMAFSKFSTQKVAIANLTTADGVENALGAAIAEMLVVKLSQVGGFQIIERSQLQKVLEEQKLGIKALFDNQSNIQKLGKLLGADAVLLGTLTELDAAIDTNMRMTSTTTGGIMASANAKIAKTSDVTAKMAQTIAAAGTTQTSSSNPSTASGTDSKARATSTGASASGEVFFKEDFSGYTEGDPMVSWGEKVVILKDEGGNKYLTSQTSAEVSFQINVNFPDNFSFEFEIRGLIDADSSIAFELISEDGKVTLLSSSSSTWGEIGFTFPGTKRIDARNYYDRSKYNQLKIQKNGGAFKFYVNGKVILSGYYPDYKTFKAFKVTGRMDVVRFRNFIGTKL
ncbi:hypothetical protein HYR99_39015 [Candidatus Poribacteria bacterium]|nr:hypothetical protein [Candidatus Poribacteria bacterium]